MTATRLPPAPGAPTLTDGPGPDGGSDAALAALARAHGIEPSFTGSDGHLQVAELDVLSALLGALGVDAAGPDAVRSSLDAADRASAGVALEPVLVCRDRAGVPGPPEAGAPITVRLPGHAELDEYWLNLESEDGATSHCRLSALATGPAHEAAGGDRGSPVAHQIDLARATGHRPPAGYHTVNLEGPNLAARSLLVCAPACPSPERTWGVFLPLHAVRSLDDWGIGSYTDLGALGRWASARRAGMVGSLPLYPLSEGRPVDPSPYLPSSKLAYNDLCIDPTAIPHWRACPEVVDLVTSDAFRRRVAAAHRSATVDYDEVADLRRQALLPLSITLSAAGSPLRGELDAFAAQHPELVAFARFRAALEGAEGPGTPGHGPRVLADYHFFCQWAAAFQLQLAAMEAPLYADLPIGVHPEGFDSQWAASAFVDGVEGGAPPDPFFAGGQHWAFRPLHPQRIRHRGYDYLIGCLRRACRHAAYLRLDHVMGLHRLYWVPAGADARHGAYVRYRSEELRAIVSLEAHRAGTVVVGEDLGTVPDEVRRDMAADGMRRSWVLQFETSPQDPLPEPPAECLASWATHDLAPFAAYFEGTDLEQGATPDAGLDDAAGGLAARQAERRQWRAALRAIGLVSEPPKPPGPAGTPAEPAGRPAPADPGVEDDEVAALRICLEHLAASPAELVLVDLDEVVGARQAQNRPGTGTEAANWRRRAIRTIEELHHDASLDGLLAALDGARRAGRPDGGAVAARAAEVG